MKIVIALLSCAVASFSCSENEDKMREPFGVADHRLQQDLEIVRNSRIYFGHQSVGFNIIEGLKEVTSSSNTAPLNFVKVGDPRITPGGFFADSQIGKNGKPDTKCRTFSETVNKDLGNSLDIALMKFCYVDFTEETDVKVLFSTYKSTIDTLQKSFPQIRFLHVTAPLATRSPGWKRFIKQLIGRQDPSDLEAEKRSEFNSLLMNEYKTEPVFDLARIESTHQDGTRSSFKSGSEEIFTLAEEYTDDGGHLNQLGRRLVAQELLHTLAQAAKSQSN